MRTVIFDLDGTLADTSADLIGAANACFRDLGHGSLLDPVADAATAMQGGRAMLRLGFGRLGQGDEAQVEGNFPRLLDHYERGLHQETRLYAGAEAALDALAAQGFLLGVCTNKPARLADLLLQSLGIRGAFASLVGADTLPVRKPDPAPYILSVRQAGGQVGRSILIGDTITDRNTGLAAGVPVALVTFGPEGRAVEALAPEALLHHFDDLPALADRLIPA